MSHNNRCYVKKLDKIAAKGYKRVDTFFRQQSLSLDNNNNAEKRRKVQSADVDLDGPSQSQVSNDHTLESSSASTTLSEPSTLSSKKPESQTQQCSDVSDQSSDANGTDDEMESSCRVPDSRLFTSAKYEARYSWLYYSAAKGMYICKFCELFSVVAPNPSGTFVTGVQSLGTHPTRKLQKHEQSKQHAEAWRRKSGIGDQKPTILIRQKWALDSVDNVMGHMAATGNESVLEYNKFNPERKYTSSSSVSEIVSCIDRYLELDILRKVKSANMYSLLADESSDESHREQFAILVRIKGESGALEDYFLGITHVKKQDAESLMSAIEDFLLRKGLDIRKALFVGFDGCNTMSEENKGLQRRFRHVVPHQIYINCRNHKLALCVIHLIKEYPAIEDVDNLLLSIWKLFHYSPRTYEMRKLRFI
ncbi:ZMYM1-like protein [Mya arenaria]|uniref:ZMYM1-like protein n=1 Tax=Mya arenaria TaxID=6604 RepID=A0ABY7EGQ5_MYAAR|nr:ZMYM1-like protein [Mya arenaria]